MSLAGLLVAATNAVWQSALLVVLAAVALRAAKADAATRASVWTVVLFVCAALTPLDLAFQARALHPQGGAGVAATAHAAPRAFAPQPLAVVMPAIRTARLGFAERLSSIAERWAVPFFGAWLFLSGLLLFRLGRRTTAALFLKRRAMPLDDAPFGAALSAMAGAVRASRVGLSDLVDMPCAVGLVRPMVLLPRSLVEGLAAEDAYAVVAHEVAHLRRCDDVVQLLQHILAAVFFFNPFLRFAGARIDFYRELACDDHVISSRASALRYAQCLATILERAALRRRSFAPAFLQGRTQVSARVERLVNWREGSHSMGRAAVLIALAVCVTALFFVRVELPFLCHTTMHHDGNVASAATMDGDQDTLLGALAAAGYHISPDDAIALSNAGVDSDLIVAIHRSGIAAPTKSEIIEMANAGVDGDLIAAAVRIFGPAISASDLVRLQNRGVDSGDLEDICSLGSGDLSVSDVIALHDAGVDGDYIRHVTAATHGKLTPSDIIRLHDAGVDS